MDRMIVLLWIHNLADPYSVYRLQVILNQLTKNNIAGVVEVPDGLIRGLLFLHHKLRLLPDFLLEPSAWHF